MHDCQEGRVQLGEQRRQLAVAKATSDNLAVKNALLGRTLKALLAQVGRARAWSEGRGWCVPVGMCPTRAIAHAASMRPHNPACCVQTCHSQLVHH